MFAAAVLEVVMGCQQLSSSSSSKESRPGLGLQVRWWLNPSQVTVAVVVVVEV
jgi:hypothetical protein